MTALFTGAALLYASMVLGLWQILSAPDRPNYPTSGPAKRSIMFVYMALLAARGIEVVMSPGAMVTETQAWASATQAALFTAFLVDHLLNWLPAKTHRNIQRLVEIASCKDRRKLAAARAKAMRNSTGGRCADVKAVGPALVALSLEGVTVAGPDESAESFVNR